MKFKYIFYCCLTLSLLGCNPNKSDLVAFVAEVKSQHISAIPPLKASPRFEHFTYQASLQKSPFVPPSKELTEENIDVTKNCLQPDLNRRKSRQETYGLDNLSMQGTLQEGNKIWALIQSSENTVFRLGSGDNLGRHHGRITQVTESHIEIIELIPDGSGCWTERTSTMELTGENKRK